MVCRIFRLLQSHRHLFNHMLPSMRHLWQGPAQNAAFSRARRVRARQHQRKMPTKILIYCNLCTDVDFAYNSACCSVAPPASALPVSLSQCSAKRFAKSTISRATALKTLLGQFAVDAAPLSSMTRKRRIVSVFCAKAAWTSNTRQLLA